MDGDRVMHAAPASFRKNAIITIVLSLLCGLTGNGFLSFTGILTGILVLLNGERAPDLIFMLSFMTGVLALVYTMTVLPAALFILFADPARICGVAEQMVRKYENYYGIFPRNAGEASPPPLAYPWNMTTQAQRDTYYATGEGAEKAHTTMAVLHKIEDLVCGEGAASTIVLFGMCMLAFCLLVLVPLTVTAMKLSRQARAMGGCSECGPTPRLVYSRIAPHQQPPPFGSRSPPVVAVPVNQAAHVSVAQPGTSSNLPMAEGKAMV